MRCLAMNKGLLRARLTIVPRTPGGIKSSPRACRGGGAGVIRHWVVAALLLALPAAAEEPRTVTLVVGHEPGTGYDLYGRTLARHLGRHLPGGPTMVVQNMPGAGGLNAANWLYNIAPRDGSVIMLAAADPLFEPLLGGATARLDPVDFT